MRRRRHDSRFSLFAFQDIITSVTGIMILITLVLAIELIERTESSPKQMTSQTIEQLEAQLAENQAEIKRLEAIQAAAGASNSRLAAIDEETLRRRLATRREQNSVLAEKIARAERAREKAQRRKSELDAQNLKSRVTEERRQQELKRKIAETRTSIKKLVSGKLIVFNPAKGISKNMWVAQISARQILVAPLGRSSRPASYSDAAGFQAWMSMRDATADYVLLVVKPDGITLFTTIREQLRSRGFAVGYDLIAADQSAVDPQHGAATP